MGRLLPKRSSLSKYLHPRIGKLRWRLKLIALYLYLRKRKGTKKRLWVHSMFQQREKFGVFHQLVNEMRLGRRESYINYFRMTPETFDKLLSLVGPLIQKETTAMRKPIPAEERLAATLRFLASGDSYINMSYYFRIHQSTLRYIIPQTCDAIWKVLQPGQMPSPSTRDWARIASEFQQFWQFPNCIGSLDGKHVLLQAPSNSGSLFFNYKKTYSIVLMAVVDAQYRFVIVDAGAYGQQSDGSVLRNSEFGKKLDEGQLELPAAAALPGRSERLPHVFVGDEAFPLRRNLMRPYPGTGLPYEKRVFNYRLSRARRIVENAFGILSSRFRIFRRPMALSPSRAELVVKACTVLHNFLRNEIEDTDEETVDHEDDEGVLHPGGWRSHGFTTGVRQLARTGRRATQEAMEIRSKFMAYFTSRGGAVPWQRNAVLSTE